MDNLYACVICDYAVDQYHEFDGKKVCQDCVYDAVTEAIRENQKPADKKKTKKSPKTSRTRKK